MPVLKHILEGKSVGVHSFLPVYAGIWHCVAVHYFNPSLPELYWKEIVYPYTISFQYMLEVVLKLCNNVQIPIFFMALSLDIILVGEF